jgi:4-amino-4-deoxy-L-arabinose transferase-like glycosyltransferase
MPASPAGAAARTRVDRPGWQRPALAGLLVVTALLNLWDLAASGWANDFYAAAVQAGTRSWKALLFGALDQAGFITVDKPPASIWVMALSGRMFGFSSWSMLVPQALMGVASVALLYASVRRVAGPGAGLLAGAVLALSPVVVLMFRFNNPDALLVLLLVASAYCVTRALEGASTRWLVLAGVAIGFGFLAKMGEALLVVPAFALAYLVAAPTGLGRRIRQLLGAGAALVVSSGWYLALVALWPADDRPYIGGSQTNSALELAVGYNGLSRLLGHSGGAHPGGLPGAARHGGFSGFGGFSSSGPTRLFDGTLATQDSWLLPAAIALLLLGLWLTRHAPRTDRTRAALLLWGGWLLVTAAVFSFMAGIFHPYYTVALAPSLAGLVGIGGHQLWRWWSMSGACWPARFTMALIVAGTSGWAWVLLDRTPGWYPPLRWAVLAVGALAVLAVLVPGGHRTWLAVVCTASVLAGLLGPAAYAVQTALTPHTGAMPTAGPGTARFTPLAHAASLDHPAPPSHAASLAHAASFGQPASVDPAAAGLLRAAGTTWSAATVGAPGAAELELASDTSVLAVGGFMGSDPTPTLARFQAMVTAGQVHYFVASAHRGRHTADGPAAGHGDSGQISNWVAQHFTPTTVGGQTWYDLTKRTR